MSARARIAIVALGVLVALGAFWMLLLSPKRDEAAKLKRDVASEQAKLAQATTNLGTALEAKKDYGHNYATVARLGQAVPADDDVPSLVFQLEHAARASGVDFRSVKLVQGATGATTSTPAPSTSTGSTSGSTSSSGSSSSGSSGTSTGTSSSTPSSTSSSSPESSSTSSSSTGTPADATQAATATLPPGAVVGSAGFPTMPFTLTFNGSFFHMSAFFRRLQRFVDVGGRVVRVRGRLLTIDGMSIQAGPKGFPQVQANLAATAYLTPADQGTTAGASASSPAPTSTSTTPTTSSTPATATVVPTR